MLWPRLWPGWSVCSWSWRDSDNGTVLQCIPVALWNAQLGAGRAAGTRHFQEFPLHSTVFEGYQHCVEEACLLLGRAAAAPPLCPGSQQIQEPTRILPGSGLLLQTPGWCSGGGGHTTCVVPVLGIQGLVRFRLSQIWHPDDWGVTEHLWCGTKIKGWGFCIDCLLQGCQCSSLVTLFLLNTSCQN